MSLDWNRGHGAEAGGGGHREVDGGQRSEGVGWGVLGRRSDRYG